MKGTVMSALALTMVCAAVVPAAARAPARVGADYVFSGDIDAGGPGFWDYLTLDAASKRLYLAHVDRVTVIDLEHRTIIGAVAPVPRAHDTVIVASVGKGYATSGGDGALKVFDLNDFHIVKDIAVGDDADGAIYDAESGDVVVMTGDSKHVAIVDPRSDSLVRSIDLPASPEFAAVDGRGALYVNLVTTSELAKIDIASGRIDAVWPLTGCTSPRGLAYDDARKRLFASCGNKALVVVDAESGKVVATLPIGGFSDDVGIDRTRHRVFSPNGDGTLTVIDEEAGDRYRVERTIPTFLGGRSMAVDPTSGALFITHGDTHVKGERTSALELRFGWDNAEIATFSPND